MLILIISIFAISDLLTNCVPWFDSVLPLTSSFAREFLDIFEIFGMRRIWLDFLVIDCGQCQRQSQQTPQSKWQARERERERERRVATRLHSADFVLCPTELWTVVAPRRGNSQTKQKLNRAERSGAESARRFRNARNDSLLFCLLLFFI